MNYPICILTSIESPSRYAVVSTEKGHVSEVKKLEKLIMSQDMSFEEPSDFTLSLEMCVGVVDKKGKLRRGVIESKLADDLYKVLLIDYGQSIHVAQSNIKIVRYRELMNVEPLAFVVVLYGLIPAKNDPVDMNTKPRALKEWTPESLTFVQNLFKNNKEVVVKSIFSKNRIVYGELFVRSPGKEFLPLRKMLCENKFCIYSETLFLKHSKCDPVCDSQGVKFLTNMELVKKWQKDCLPYLVTKTSESFRFPKMKHFRVPIPKFPMETSSSQGVSPPSPVSHETSKESRELVDKEQISEESTLGVPKTYGHSEKMKLNMPTVETVKSEEAAAVGNGESSLQRDPLSRPEVRVPKGRGLLLQLYWESKKAISEREKSKSTSLSGVSRIEENSWDTSSYTEKFSNCEGSGDVNVTRNSSKTKRVTIKSGEHSELSVSNEDGPSPLASVKIEPSMTVQKRENSNKSLTEETLKFESESSKLVPTGTLSDSNESTVLINLQSAKQMPSDKNFLEWPTNLLGLSSWTPYVLFEDAFVEPVNTFAELQIRPSIIKNLEKRGSFRNLSQIQRWAIPVIHKQQNIVLIGSPKTGKTISYIVPVLDYVMDESYLEELPSGNGPAVVIVVSGSRACEAVYYMCHSLLGNRSDNEKRNSPVQVVMAHGNGCEEEAWVSLTNGCDILISTPPCLVRLSEMPTVTNFERLTCLVLDEIDVISQNPFRKSLRKMLEKTNFSTKDRFCQKILCGEKLTPAVNEIIKSYVKSFTLVIASYSEAVIYERLKPSIFLVDRTRKRETLANKLKDRINHTKILIVCELTSTAIDVGNFLSDLGISALLAHEEMLAMKLTGVRRAWKSSTNAVMIASDGILNELNIKDVRTLIHYDLPSVSKTNFYLRYSTLKNFLLDKQSFLETRERFKNSDVEVVIFVDDENYYQLPHMVDFVCRLGGEVSSKILQKCEEIRRQVEVDKRDFPICRNLLSFGTCRRSKTCPRRHAFVEEWDSRGNLPTSGWVNFAVLRSHDASCFSARLIEHVDAEGNISRLEDRYLEYLPKLSQYYRNEDNRRVLVEPKTGVVCAVRKLAEEREVFHRAKVIEYLEVDKHQNPVEVAVKLLDHGDVWRRKVMELYELPEELSKFPPSAIDVILVGVQPMDYDDGWGEVANYVSANIMTQEMEGNQYWSGRIALALNSTLFMDTIRRKEFLPPLNTHVFDLAVERELVNNRLAVGNDEHLPALLRLCREAGMEILKKEEKKEKESTALKPQWAFFESDYVQVRFLSAESTSVIFLQPRKSEKALEELEEECQKAGAESAERVAVEMEGRKPSEGALSIGTFCLALFEDGKWNRGRIESENEDDFQVFFVDHGDFLFVPKSDVVPISESLLLRLPCQAVECRLVGIEEREECPVEVLREIYSFSEDGKEYLNARVVSGDLKPIFTKGKKYSLNLVDATGISLNKKLVDLGFVEALETERQHLENVDLGEQGQDEKEENSLFNLGDDLLENADDQSFLMEFASRIFHVPPTAISAEDKGECSDAIVSVRGDAPPAQNVQRPQMLCIKDQNQSEKKLRLKNRENVLTPRVLWYQSQVQVHLKILLDGVKDYSLECTVNNVSFRCLIGEKFYAMDLRLYGAINPSLTKVTVRALHVQVALTKLAYPPWPRLPEDQERAGWITLDVEGHCYKDRVFSERIRIAKMEIEAEKMRKGTRDDDISLCSDSEYSDAVLSHSSTEDDDG